MCVFCKSWCKIEKAFFFFCKMDRNYASTNADALRVVSMEYGIKLHN